LFFQIGSWSNAPRGGWIFQDHLPSIHFFSAVAFLYFFICEWMNCVHQGVLIGLTFFYIFLKILVFLRNTCFPPEILMFFKNILPPSPKEWRFRIQNLSQKEWCFT
jgi:hypothetical protein